jgi:hypothetical protein
MDPEDAAELRDILDLNATYLVDMAEPQAKSPVNARYMSFTGPSCTSSNFDPREIAESSQLLQDYFVSTGRLLCNVSDERPELGPQGLVLHMRSGDIMRPVRPGIGPQPPCDFYASVVLNGNNGKEFGSVLIVTEPDFSNPCVYVVQERFPSQVKVQSRSIREDACVVALAQNLATAGYSTFDAGLIRLNTRLKHLHVPFGNDNRTEYYTDPNHWAHRFLPWMVREEGMPYAQHIYTFPNYDTKWRNYTEMQGRMVAYPHSAIVKRSIPVSQFPPASSWI